MNRNRRITLGLIVSLALNAAFLASLFYHRRQPRPSQPLHRETFSIPFPTDPGQKEKISRILRQFRLDSLALKQDILTRRVEILEELGNPSLDTAAIRSKTDELNTLEDQLNNRFVSTLLDISDILDSNQRLQLIYRLSRDWYSLNHSSEKGGFHE